MQEYLHCYSPSLGLAIIVLACIFMRNELLVIAICDNYIAIISHSIVIKNY